MGRRKRHQQPPYGQPYPPYPQQVTVVRKKRGLSLMAHGAHFWVGVFTCGLWWMVWFFWWLIRLVVPRKDTERHHYR